MTIELKERTLQSKLLYWADLGKAGMYAGPAEAMREAAAQLDALTTERDTERERASRLRDLLDAEGTDLRAENAKLLQQCAKVARVADELGKEAELADYAARSESLVPGLRPGAAKRKAANRIRAALAPDATASPEVCGTCVAHQREPGWACPRCGRVEPASPERGTGDDTRRAFVRAINALIVRARDDCRDSVTLDELTRAITDAHATPSDNATNRTGE